MRSTSSSTTALSRDGLVVAFFSAASNLVADDANVFPPLFTTPGNCPDIFVQEMTGDTT
jgi:hypothetical protein